MITCPGPYVIPGQELARLTLISPPNEAVIRRRSTVSAARPSVLGEINGMPILGPLGPPQAPTAESEARDPSESTTIAETEKPRRTISDGDSDATLVSDNVKHNAAASDTHAHGENKGPAPSSGDVVMADSNNDTAPDAGDAGVGDESVCPKEPAAAAEPIEPPSQPPPVPPRPTPQVDPQKQLIEEVEIGAQQDVTEVINNVLFQSECAIRPIGIAPDGEQLDQVKEYVFPFLLPLIT